MIATESEVSLNNERQLYVIPCVEGYSCWGFQNAWDECGALIEMLDAGTPKPAPEMFGTIELYTLVRKLQRDYANSPISKRTWFSPKTPKGVRKALESARKDGGQIRIWLGENVTGRSWLEEHDTIGAVGRSMGPQRVPLLVPQGDTGGGAILTNCVIRIRDERTKKDLYRHPKFHVPHMELADSSEPGLPAEVRIADERGDMSVHARFESTVKAHAYIAWLAGEDFTP